MLFVATSSTQKTFCNKTTYFLKKIGKKITVKTGKEITGAILTLALSKPKEFAVGSIICTFGGYLLIKTWMKSIFETLKSTFIIGAGITFFWIAATHLDNKKYK